MKLDKNGKLAGLVLTLICYAAFVGLFITVVAYAFDTDPSHFLQLQG